MTGIGIQKAGKIFMGALMRKTSNWRYVNARSASLAASVVAVIATRAFDKNRMDATLAAEVATWMNRSQTLEAQLREIDPEYRVLNGATAGAVSELEDRIAAVDAEISQPLGNAAGERELRLWRDRVGLMQGLVNVHQTRAVYLGM